MIFPSKLISLGAGETAQLVGKYLPGELENVRLIPRSHIVKPSVVVFTGKAKTG